MSVILIATQDTGEPPKGYIKRVAGGLQHVIFDGLKRGVRYTAQVGALGGSTGQFDWTIQVRTWRCC